MNHLELRKELKKLGFKISYRKTYFIREHRIVGRIKDMEGNEKPSIFSGNQYEHWKPVLDLIKGKEVTKDGEKVIL